MSEFTYRLALRTFRGVPVKKDTLYKRKERLSTSPSQMKLCSEAFFKTDFWILCSAKAVFVRRGHLFSVVCTLARLVLLNHLSEALLGFYMLGSMFGSMSFFICNPYLQIPPKIFWTFLPIRELIPFPKAVIWMFLGWNKTLKDQPLFAVVVTCCPSVGSLDPWSLSYSPVLTDAQCWCF